MNITEKEKFSAAQEFSNENINYTANKETLGKDAHLLVGESLFKEFVIERIPIIGRPKKTFTAVDEVSITIEEGKTLGLVGESGSGKSTMGEILGDLQRPTRGRVLYRGKDITEMTQEEYNNYRRNVQFIFQDPKSSMNPYYTIGEIIAEPLESLKVCCNEEERAKRVLEMIERVGLSGCSADKYPGELSGGQCQRVAIARALVVNPKVIICDEPVSALDVSIQAQILNLLRDLQQEFNIAYLFISHDIGVVNYMADDIIVLNHGEIVEKGEAGKVFSAPRHDYTKKLVAASFVN